MCPARTKKACQWPAAVCADPAMSPPGAIAVARLLGPPNVPRSVIVPAAHRKAWLSPPDVSEVPTITSFESMPSPFDCAPPSVPMSVNTALPLTCR